MCEIARSCSARRPNFVRLLVQIGGVLLAQSAAASEVSVSLHAVGVSDPVLIDLRKFRNGTGLILSVSGTATASVQVTGDNPGGNKPIQNWNNHDTMVNLTASANGNLLFPPTAVRLNVTVCSGCNVVLSVVQAENGP